MMEVNATLVETLLDCLLEDLTCPTVAEYVMGDLTNAVSGDRVNADGCLYLTFFSVIFASPIIPRGSGRVRMAWPNP